MGIIDGLAAAFFSPAILTVGFYFWDNAWTGSAVVLNAFKGCFAATLFLLVIVILAIYSGRSFWPEVPEEDTAMVWLSSFLGIVLGDSFWLLALARIGARRVILIDAIKPFLSAVAAAFMLQETPGWQVVLGMFITSSGVLCVALEKKPKKSTESIEEHEVPSVVLAPAGLREVQCGSAAAETVGAADVEPQLSESVHAPGVVLDGCCLEKDGDDKSTKVTRHLGEMEELTVGYAMSALNCLFDVAGALLTKRHGRAMTTWHINVLRFGSAGFEIALFLLLASAAASMRGQQTLAWAALPRLSTRSWFMICTGVFFATFCTPALHQYALFQIDLAVYTTLISMGPVWALPVGVALKNEGVSLRTLLGSTFAVAGVVPMALGQAERT